MDKRKDIIIVSAYGRGNWLATEMATKDFSVGLVDVTGSMGRWSPDDWESPFGFFAMEGLDSIQTARLTEDAPQERVDQGFCVWSGHGLIESKGPMFSHQIEQSGLSAQVQTYLAKSSRKTMTIEPKLTDGLREQSFSENWLAQLSHNLSSNISCESTESLDFGSPLPILADHYLRRVSRDSLNKSLEWCRKNGVSIFSGAKVNDVYLEGRSFGGVELSWEKSGVAQGKYLIWTLTSEETQRLPDSVHRLMFPRGAIDSEWSWTRFRFNLKTEYFFNNLPPHFVIIEDLFLPWSGTNTLIVQKGVSMGLVDIWLKIPSSQRFLKPYLQKVSDNILDLLRRRMTGAEVSLENFPQDYYYDYSEMGACPFPVYDEMQMDRLYPAKIKNVYFDGPEQWTSLDWAGQFRSQEKIRDEIVSIREKELRNMK